MTDYRNAIEKLTKKLGLKIKKKFREGYEFGYFIYMGSIDERDVILRVVPASDHAKYDKMKREQIVSNKYYQIYGKSGKNLIAKIISMDSNETFIWTIRQYYPYLTLSDDDNTAVLFNGYDYIRKEFLKDDDQIIKSICAGLTDFQSLDIKIDENLPKSEKYIQNFDQLDGEIFKKYLDINVEKYQKLFNQPGESYFKESNKKPCMGDFSPANILIKNPLELIFYDFEYFCLDHPMLDLSYLWIFLWRYPNWQNKLLNIIIKDNKSEDDFRFSVIRSILSIYQEGILGHLKYKNKEYVNKLADKYKNHIWTKYLTNADLPLKKLVGISSK